MAWGQGAFYGLRHTVQSFKDEMTGTTSVLGRDKSIEVQFSGDKSYARDGVVNFPNLDPTQALTHDELSLYRGWVDHESAKLRYSDKGAMSNANGLKKRSPILYDLFTTIEGVRVEEGYVDIYKGAGKNLGELARKTTQVAIARHEDAKNPSLSVEVPTELDLSGDQKEKINAILNQQAKALEPYKDPQSIIPAALGVFGRKDFHGVYNYRAEKDLAEYLDIEKLEKWAEEIKNLKSTSDSMKLAKRILEEMKNPPEPQEQSGDSNGESSGDDEKKEGEGKGDSQGSEEGQGDGGEPSKEDDKEEDESEDKEEPQEEKEDEPKDSNEDTKEDLNKEHEQEQEYNVAQENPDNYRPVSMDEMMIVDTPRSKSKDVPYRVLDSKHDAVYHWSDGWKPNIEAYTEAKSEIDSSISVMKRKIELMIQAKRKLEWSTMKEMGRFDSKRMVGAYNADQNVFKTREDSSDLDTAITILVDLSGSMCGGKAKVAMKTAILLAECLDKIGVPFNITGFDCDFTEAANNDSAFMRKVYGADNSKWGRIEPLKTHEFKRFSDRMFDARKYMHRIGSLEGSGQNNNDAENVFNAGQLLLKRPEKRKIMFVLSDGSPCALGNNNAMYKKLKDVVSELSRQMDVVGIGICTPCVKEFYPKNVHVNNAEELPTTCLNLLKEALIEGDKK